ncbi:hypothetical protein H0H92_009674, partial [Tricholoma furcatifolium]
YGVSLKPAGVPAPYPINNKSPELCAEIEKEAEDDYNEALMRYREGDAWQPHTAEEYAQAMDNSPQILLPIADMIAEQFSVYMAIMLCGPMSDGKIGLRSAVVKLKAKTYQMLAKEECAARKAGLNEDELFQKDLEDLQDFEEDAAQTTLADTPTPATTPSPVNTSSPASVAASTALPLIDPVLLEMEAGKAGGTVEGNSRSGGGKAVQQELCKGSAESQVNKDAPDTTMAPPDMSTSNENPSAVVALIPEVSEPARGTSPLAVCVSAPTDPSPMSAVQASVTIEVPAMIHCASPSVVQVPAPIEPSPMPALQVPAPIDPSPMPASSTHSKSMTGAQTLALEMILPENYIICDGLAYLQAKEWGIG